MKKQILKTLETHLQNLYEWDHEEEVLDDIRDTKAQIEYMKEEIIKDEISKYEKQLQEFKEFMYDTFDKLLGDNGDDKTCDDFYSSAWEITWRGKTVKIENGAEVFNGIEDIIDTELENI